MGRIIILSGPPGAGKTTIAERLSGGAAASHSLHMRTDDWYTYVRKGYVPPWRPESANQNLVLIHAMAASATICAKGGFEVYADGVLGPAYLDPWRNAARDHALELHYVVLLPGEVNTVGRATARTGPGAMRDPEVAQLMWRRFDGYEFPPGCRIDTTGQAVEATLAEVCDGLATGRFRLV